MLNSIGNFDLARLNFVGWLLFIFCVGFAIAGICLIVGTPLDISDGHGFLHEVKSHALGFVLSGISAIIFVAGRKVLDNCGISIFRKGMSDPKAQA